jgi:CHAT domain-containing protein
MRYAVQAEPGPLRVLARTGEAALDECLELFGPVADLLRDEHAAGRRHLMIVPHGPLHFAPLHLLPVDGKPLAETWTVTYLPNLALLATPPPLADDKTAAAAVGLGFADGTLPPIPEAVEEATAVAAKLGIHPLVDAEATETAVLDALAHARTFHIATHGAHNVAAPAFQRLYVADEEISAHELLRLDLRGLDLITLSACETALGRFDVADNLRGIPANLLLRGARTVVGTLWPVESHTSRDFFTTLYEMLHEGRPKLAAYTGALRRTRLDHPEYRDWGAFYYVGDWR